MAQISIQKTEITIFISSPGDVSAERMIADRVIRKLQKEYAKFANIRSIIWENLPLTATHTFQDGINEALKEKGVDIAVFILGSRLGSAPGNNYMRPDGTRYQSGTEYEYDFMLHLHELSGRPEILVYRKVMSEHSLFERYHNLDELNEANRQNNMLKEFIQEHFEDKKLGAYLAYHKIDETINFESRLATHLRGLLQKLLNNPIVPKYDGNPYRGLMAFQQEDEEIYFGRGQEVQQLEANILNFISRTDALPMVFVCGASGTGKSSLVNAGLIPDLLTSGLKSGRICHVERISPQKLNGSFYSGLLDLIAAAIPELRGDKYFESLYRISQLSVQDMAVIDKAIEKKAEKNSSFIPLIFIDQFEEFFTDMRLTATERAKSVQLLRALQQTGKILIILTVRSDFYQMLTSDMILLEIKKNAIVWDIPSFSSSELREIIEEPARMTGVQWEKEKEGGAPLNDLILDDALQLQSLPLLEFALTTLYEQREGNVISYKVYHSLGGLVGAIKNYANQVYYEFNKNQQVIFSDMLGMFITVTEDGTKFNRKDMILDDYILTTEQKQVIDILVSKRLFSISRNFCGKAVCTVAHEFLINHWEIVIDWLQRERELLERRKHFEMEEARWREHDKKSEYVTVNETEIAEAEDLLLCWEKHLPKNLLEYFTTLNKQDLKRWRWSKTIFIGSISFYMLAAIIFLCYSIFSLEFRKNNLSTWNDEIGIQSNLLIQYPSTYVFLLYYPFFYFICTIFMLWRKWCNKTRVKKDFIAMYFGITCVIIYILKFCVEIFTFHYKIIYIHQRTFYYIYLGLDILNFIILLIFMTYTIIKVKRYKLRKIGKLNYNPPNTFIMKIISNIKFSLFVIFSIFMLIRFVNLVEELNLYKKEIEKLINFIPDNGSQTVVELDKLTKAINAYQNGDSLKSIPEDINFTYAQTCYNLCMSDQALKYGFGEKLKTEEERVLLYNIAIDLGNDSKNDMLKLAYNSSTFTSWTKVWFALKAGDVENARVLSVDLTSPDNNNISSELLHYAHYLLLVKQNTQVALSIYKQYYGYICSDGQLWNNKILCELAYLKQHEEFRATIERIESKIDLKPIPISFSPSINIEKDLPQFIGNWTLENKGIETFLTRDMEKIIYIASNNIYVLYNLQTTTYKKCLMRLFMRYKISLLPDNKYLLEEINPRDGSISISILSFIDDNTFNLEVLFNNNTNVINQKLIYRRIVN